MKRIFGVACMAALALSTIANAASAAPTEARHYEAIPATCQEQGEIVIEVTNLGNWGTGKVQGSQHTLIPRTFHFVGTHLESGTQVFEESLQKNNAEIDDVCVFSFVEEIPADDPFLPGGGTLLIEGTVGVKVVGP